MDSAFNHKEQIMIGHQVGQAGNAIRHAFMFYLRQKKIKLTPEQFIVLKRVYREKKMTQNEIACYFLRDNASITRVLDGLEKKHLIERIRSKEDRRVNYIHVTAQGEAFLKSLFPHAETLNQLLLDDVSPEELSLLKKVLDKIVNNAAVITKSKTNNSESDHQDTLKHINQHINTSKL